MGNVKKLLTLEQLAKFCEDNNFLTFNSKDSGYTLSVQVPGDLVFEEDKEDDAEDDDAEIKVIFLKTI